MVTFHIIVSLSTLFVYILYFNACYPLITALDNTFLLLSEDADAATKVQFLYHL